ncbi:response regulator [Sansalvadorimonas sp. 2012CJ34-2]|uniref:histidine kinase n=1 Tax=Parendozoicomonas callyspongiae TaxID=2942213 RepID=A0ABT0PCK5_9GAMM|nr:response regulator [Sansalvadorimonas sp. 2012CJ34-2]MCL6269118.1 response regulator [Sansalvadorimonas sp. 2012CJ34-2]
MTVEMPYQNQSQPQNQTLISSGQNDDDEKILLVDDNPTNLQVLLQTLNGRGYKLLIAKDGENALRIAHKAKPALILLDIMMPGIDGYEVCRRLKADPEMSSITVIFLSALDDTQDKVRGLETGAVDYIAKPFQAEEVIARVETQLKIHQLEQALAARNRQLEAANQRLLETMREGIFGVDAEGRITFANPAASRMTGWDLEELTGGDFYGMFLERNPEGIHAPRQNTPLYRTLVDGVIQNVDDSVFCRQNESFFPVDYSCTPITEGGKNNGAVVVFRDITEKKRQQEILQQALDEVDEQKDKLTHMSRLSSMGEMASGFAHEVNQPLTAINNYAQVCKRMVAREPMDVESIKEAMGKIATQAQRAGDIISRIRSFVKKPDHCLERVDCNRLIQDVVKLAEVDARNNQIEIHIDLEEGLAPVRVDPVQIQQVALNLMRNAMEAMRDTATRDIGIRVETLKVNDDFVQVRVIDRGHGLADDAEEKMFTPFYTTKQDGMGIGLSVCHSIIQTHGGVLNFERNPEGGAILWFTVPVA